MAHGVPPFGPLWIGYPSTNDSTAVRKSLGGECDDPNWVNTCAMRMSMALWNAGVRLPERHGLYTVRAANPPWKGARIALRQIELANYLESLWGAPLVVKTKPPFELPGELAGKKGVVSFFGIPGYLGGRGGHLDVFDGAQTRHGGYWNSDHIWFWAAA